MRNIAFEPCLPSRGTKVPASRDWIHEIKHDGYRLIVQRDGQRVRLFSRNGHNFTDRYPAIAEAALRNTTSQFVVDGEAVLLGVDGISDFDGLHSRKHDEEVQLYAFDILAIDGNDLRKLPLHLRKNNLAQLLARRPEGIFIAPFEQVPKGLRVWAGGVGLQAPGKPVPRRHIIKLDKGEEPRPSGDGPGQGRFQMTTRTVWIYDQGDDLKVFATDARWRGPLTAPALAHMQA